MKVHRPDELPFFDERPSPDGAIRLEADSLIKLLNTERRLRLNELQFKLIALFETLDTESDDTNEDD